MTNDAKAKRSKPKSSANDIPVDIQLAIDVWKTDIQVQQHFNLIEMQIRSIAITVVTTTIGAASLTANAQLSAIGTDTSKLILGLSPASLIIIAGLIAWIAFYSMDRFWYHRLLKGSVTHSQYIESALKDRFPYLGLSQTITQKSPYKLFWLIEIHSEQKIDGFYLIIGLLLAVLAFFVF